MQEVLRLSREDEIVDLGVDGVEVPMYKGVQGRAVDVVPEFVRTGRIWLSEADVMEKRLERHNELPDWGDSLRCSDLIAYGSREQGGKVKFVFMYDNSGSLTEDGKLILEYLKPDANLVNGAIESNSLYYGLSGVGEFSRDNLGVLGNAMTRAEILDSLVWKIGARHPDNVNSNFAHKEHLLNNYADFVRRETGEEKNMTVYLDVVGDVAKLRAWCVGRLGSGSCANGRSNLDYDFGCFAGKLAPEARVRLDRIKNSLSE